ncbi:N-acetyltransferase family protein [Williamsia sp. MIQD14]|uniref:GNAT family N-acetyltransferase n=1 Tax=Williamsia sp. MIQD14 TaxID=3425703 RepID=UPI003DA135CB
MPTAAIVTIDTCLDDATEVAEVAAATFPLACPPGTTEADTADFIGKNLTAAHFRDHLTAADRDVVVARVDGAIVGYCLVVHGEPTDPEVQAVVTQRPVSELSKMYVLPQAHGAGAAHQLMSTAIAACADRGSIAVWLGVSNVNLRAQRFYDKAGFTEVGRKSFWLNGDEQRDFVMVRSLR